MTLHEWAAKWHIPIQAIADLQREYGLDGTFTDTFSDARGEAGVSAMVRLEASRKGLRLWRNNVGALESIDGRQVRFGLANDSATVNKRMKSADLIGIRPRLISQRDVGAIIGQFVSRETKAPGWRYAATDRETAQKRWLELIIGMGGDAAFATGEGTL